MKRSDALKVLSHQHHQGLFASLQLKRADPETAAERLERHIRFEERELFPRIEAALPDHELGQLGAAFARAEAGHAAN